MKKFSINKKNGIINIEIENVKTFNLQNLITLLDSHGLTFYSEHFDLANDKTIATMEDVCVLNKNSLFTVANVFQVFEQLNKQKLDCLILLDGKTDLKDVDELVSILTNKVIRFFIDIDWSENQVHILINSKCYDDGFAMEVKKLIKA